MTIQRTEHVAIVVDDLAATTAFVVAQIAMIRTRTGTDGSSW
jgi:hypothetical protein